MKASQASESTPGPEPECLRLERDLGCVCFFHLMLNIIFFKLNTE